jgi:hypothetical protein
MTPVSGQIVVERVPTLVQLPHMFLYYSAYHTSLNEVLLILPQVIRLANLYIKNKAWATQDSYINF